MGLSRRSDNFNMEESYLTRRHFLGASAGLLAGGCFSFPDIGSEKIEYELRIGEQDKKTIVFNHELGGSRHSLEHLADFWNAKGYTTLNWSYLDSIHSIQGNSDVLHRLLLDNEIKNPVHVGISMGGFVSLDYALRYGNYSGLVLVSTGHRTGRLPDYEKEQKKYLSLALLGNVFYFNAPAEEIDKPALVICGDEDEFFPMGVINELVGKLSVNGAGCLYKILKGEKHDIAWKKPDEVNDFILRNREFLFGEGS